GVEPHRPSRPADWPTVETTDLPAALAGTPAPLLADSVTSWLTAVLDQAGAWHRQEGYEDALRSQTARLLAAWQDRRTTAVLVSDEVGWGVVPPTWAGRLFRD